jgi:hypothetical protein
MHTSKYTTSSTRRCALVAGVALLVLASCSSDKSISGASASTTSSSSVAATSTTLDPTATTVIPSATTEPSAPLDPTLTTVSAAPTTAAGPAPTAAPPAPPVAGYTALGASRLVMLTEDDNVFNVSELTCSEGMSFDFGEVEQCVQQDGLLVISYRIPEAKRVVEVYSLVGTSWVEAYRTTEEYDFELTAVDLYIGDYAGIGYPSAFIGYRIDGTGHYLDFDIVQATAGPLDVRGIRGIDHGNVGLPGAEPGVVVSALFADSDPNCCPTSTLYQSLDYVGGAWSVNDGTLYPTASAPVWAFAF